MALRRGVSLGAEDRQGQPPPLLDAARDQLPSHAHQAPDGHPTTKIRLAIDLAHDDAETQEPRQHDGAERHQGPREIFLVDGHAELLDVPGDLPVV